MRCQNCPRLTCQNGGTCIKEEGKEKCHCMTGYYGKACEHRSNCTSQYCLNGGTCRMGTKQPSCICPPLFSGKKCEIDLCAGNDPVLGCSERCSCKGHGVCQMVGQEQLCNCRDEWGGENCEVSFYCNALKFSMISVKINNFRSFF